MQGTAPDDFRKALRDVADTAYACKLWFESYGLVMTASDVMSMTRLVMEREAEMKAAEAAELGRD